MGSLQQDSRTLHVRRVTHHRALAKVTQPFRSVAENEGNTCGSPTFGRWFAANHVGLQRNNVRRRCVRRARAAFSLVRRDLVTSEILENYLQAQQVTLSSVQHFVAAVGARSPFSEEAGTSDVT